MKSNSTASVHAPWGYEYLPTQDAANSQWWWQVVQCLTLGGYIWDIALSMAEDIEFLVRRSPNYVTMLYILNRASCTVCIVGYFVLTSLAIPSCAAVSVMIPISESITLFTSCALLVIRVWVVYRHQPYVPTAMVMLMIPGPILNIIAWVPQTASPLPDHSGCMPSLATAPGWGYLPFVFQAIFDVLVFALCLGKVLYRSRSEFAWHDIFHLSSSADSPSVAHLRIQFVRGGFIYYIPNVITQVATLVFLGQPRQLLKYIVTPAATAVASAQALRITRKIWKFGLVNAGEDFITTFRDAGAGAGDAGAARRVDAMDVDVEATTAKG